MHKHARRLLALAALSLAATAATAQSWPTQPIRWIVPYPAGGGADVVARTVASGIEKPLGQTIAVSYTHLDVYKRQPSWRTCAP